MAMMVRLLTIADLRVMMVVIVDEGSSNSGDSGNSEKYNSNSGDMIVTARLAVVI
jgi:hypothetical protein